MLALCSAPEAEIATERLARPQFGLHRVEWHDADGPSVEFHLPHGELIRLLRETGFEVEALHELQPAADAEEDFPHVSREWARQWPSEEIWVTRKR